MNPSSLRTLILQKAVSGKLVPQIASDGTAEELLKQIEAERASLIKAGKIKKEKPLPEITEDEIPFKIPKSWKWVRFGNVLDVRDGTHNTPKYYQTGFPLVTSKNLDNGFLNLKDIQYISKEDYEKINERSNVECGDILYAMIGTIGNPVIVTGDDNFAIKNVALFKIIRNTGIIPQYLYIYLCFSQDLMKKQASGGLQSFVSLKFLREYLMPLPPLSEQKRIVAKIEDLMTEIDNIERLQSAYAANQDVLMQKIIEAGITGKLVPQIASEGTAEELLKQIEAERADLIKAGKIKKEKPLPEITEDEILFEIPKSWKWVRIGNILNLHAGKLKNTSEIKDSPFPASYPCYGGNGLRGYVSDYNQDGEHCIIGRQGALCGNINYADGKFYATEHAVVVDTFFNCNTRLIGLFLEALNLNQYATSVAQPGLAVSSINTKLFPLPPLAEQKRIVAKIEELMQIIDNKGINWNGQGQMLWQQ